MMTIIGKNVYHDSFGAGKIVLKEDKSILVKFNIGEKRFQYPDAFKKYLSVKDINLKKHIQQVIVEEERIEQERLEKERLEKEKLNSIAAAYHADIKSKRGIKKTERSNIAFKCTYCDGGKTQNTIGFNGVCSDAMIRYNIEEVHRIWCSDIDCPCRKYLDGEINRKELCDCMTDDGIVCYESAMLRDWKASAGRIHTGKNRGKPMKLSKIQANSLVILTSRKPYTTEEKRFIFAVFLVDEYSEGDIIEEGYVKTNSK